MRFLAQRVKVLASWSGFKRRSKDVPESAKSASQLANFFIFAFAHFIFADI
jgi:hypothetical protein